MKFRSAYVIMVVMMSLCGFSQYDSKRDSLKALLKKPMHDTMRCRILGELAEIASDEEWPAFNDEMFLISEKKLGELSKEHPEYKIYLKYYAGALGNKGLLAKLQGKVDDALLYYEKCIRIQEELKITSELGTTLNNISIIYYNLGDMPKAFAYQQRSLKIYESIGEKFGIANGFSNLAAFYQALSDYDKALEYHFMSLKIKEQIGDKRGISVSYNNIGFIYCTFGDPEAKQYKKNLAKENLAKAEQYHQMSLKMREEFGDSQFVALSLTNLGLVALVRCKDSSLSKEIRKEQQEKALDYLKKSIRLQENSGLAAEITWAYNYIATIYMMRKEYDLALSYLNKALTQSKKMGYLRETCSTAKSLCTLYRSTGDYKAALEYYELFVQSKDSLSNIENKKAGIKSQLKYEYEKKAAADSVKTAEEKKVVQAQLKQEQVQRYSLLAGLAFVFIFSLIMVNRFRITNKQKKLIEEQKKLVEMQKHLVEVKQGEILDSIHYAKRIQTALVTSEFYIDKELKKMTRKN